MPNKDSFTFSDKLRKSKSVPLSKRLPSVVGGQNKQKRTLVQRAQRDLPFIIVAACALLLLPFLSKNGTGNIPSPAGYGWAEPDEPDYAGGGAGVGAGDIMPPDAMPDPLRWIVTPKSEEDKGQQPQNALKPENSRPKDGFNPNEYRRRNEYENNKRDNTSPRTNYNERKDFDKKYTDKEKKPSTIDKFKEKTKPAVRNSVVRKGTEINRALRLSQIPANKGATSVSHALPIGQAPVTQPSTPAPNPGVRPVALQPMDARGTVGRSMTGENLYAEAARSINAMNAGRGAKANLLAAQMKDVDGALTPFGAGGSFSDAGSPRPGAGGGGPNNTNGYSVQKPWWWSMMETRSQKWWDLFQYKWREKLWTNIYDLIFDGGKQIASCLLFGNKDIDVSNMFGKRAGDDDYVCKTKNIPSLQDYMKYGQHDTTTKDGGKETGYSFSPKEWFDLCGEGNYEIKPDSATGFFGVRAKCLGLDILWKKIKAMASPKVYEANCTGVNKDPLTFTYKVTKNGQERERLEKKTVIAIVAKVNKADGIAEQRHNFESSTNNYYGLQGQEVVIYAQMGNKLEMPWSNLEAMYDPANCELTKVIAFVPKQWRDGVENAIGQANYVRGFDAESYTRNNPRQYSGIEGDTPVEVNPDRYDRNLQRAQNNAFSESVNSYSQFRAQVDAARTICKSGSAVATPVHPLTLNGVYDFVDFVSTGGDETINWGIKDGSMQICKIYDRANWPGIGEKTIEGVTCINNDPYYIRMVDDIYYSAKVNNPEGLNIFAVLVEEIDGAQKPKVRNIIKMNEHNKGACDQDKPTNCVYSFKTSAGGMTGYQPNKQAGEVRTDTPNGNQSSHQVSDPTQGNELGRESESEYNTGTLQENEANRKLCAENYKDVADPVEKGNLITQCVQQLNGRLSHSNYQAHTTSNSSGSADDGTARGSGKVFWILTKADTLKVNILQELDVSLGQLEADGSNFVDDVQDADYCEYRWCEEMGSCSGRNEPRDPAPDKQCVLDGIKYPFLEFTTADGTVLKLKSSIHGVPYSRNDLEVCTDVCYEMDPSAADEINYPVYIINNGVKQDTPIGTLATTGLASPEVVQQCPIYCKDSADGKFYPAEGIMVEGQVLYFKTSTTAKRRVTEGPDCSYAAWLEREPLQVFLLESKWATLPITYDSTVHTPDTNIYEENRDFFDRLKLSCIGSSYDCELLPQLQELSDPYVERLCEDSSKRVIFAIGKNNRYELRGTTVEQLRADIGRCLEASIANANNSGQECKLYLYGYSSAACRESNVNVCKEKNLTLSIDRVRYFVDDIISHTHVASQLNIDSTGLDAKDNLLSKRFDTAPGPLSITTIGTFTGNSCTIVLDAIGQEGAVVADETTERFVVLRSQPDDRAGNTGIGIAQLIQENQEGVPGNMGMPDYDNLG